MENNILVKCLRDISNMDENDSITWCKRIAKSALKKYEEEKKKTSTKRR